MREQKTLRGVSAHGSSPRNARGKTSVHTMCYECHVLLLFIDKKILLKFRESSKIDDITLVIGEGAFHI